MTKSNEADAAIESRYVDIERDGATMRAYYAEPKGAGAGTPSVVMTMHIWGLDADQRESADRFAKAGFACIVPDLYARFGAPSGEGATDHRPFMPFVLQLKTETVDPDVRAAARWVKARLPDSKTVIAGFCMGGRMALHRTAGYGDLFSAAAVWYGSVDAVDPAMVEIPVVGSYGANDHGISVDKVEAFRDALRVKNDIKIYPNAEHAFCDSTRSAYQPEAAEDSWRRAIEFLRAAVRPGSSP